MYTNINFKQKHYKVGSSYCYDYASKGIKVKYPDIKIEIGNPHLIVLYMIGKYK